MPFTVFEITIQTKTIKKEKTKNLEKPVNVIFLFKNYERKNI